ncbi:hypothetical protein C1H46_000253 [Malus baccata]|uniref:Uncharacterized protein n=1 Tax=Malus baccata TaxID=106549 RepID=A0A540NTG2_MALBA|nr:hypothetical protein C1H46_000253 [Malus baccata]
MADTLSPDPELYSPQPHQNTPNSPSKPNSRKRKFTATDEAHPAVPPHVQKKFRTNKIEKKNLQNASWGERLTLQRRGFVGRHLSLEPARESRLRVRGIRERLLRDGDGDGYWRRRRRVRGRVAAGSARSQPWGSVLELEGGLREKRGREREEGEIGGMEEVWRCGCGERDEGNDK